MRRGGTATLGCLVALAAATARADEVDDLVARARAGSLAARLAAIHELGKRASPRALEALSGALSDEKGPIRAEAAWAVSRLEPGAVVAAVTTLARTGSPEARLAAFEALAQLPGDAGMDVLEDCALDREPQHAAIVTLVRDHASRARRAAFEEAVRYRERRFPASIPAPARAALEALRRAARQGNPDRTLREKAEAELEALGAAAAEPLLAAARLEPQRAALYFTRSNGRPRVPVEVLAAARGTGAPRELMDAALRALDAVPVETDSEREALEAALLAGKLDDEVARRAVVNLSSRVFKQAAPALRRLAASGSEAVRAAAVMAFAAGGKSAEVRGPAAALLGAKDAAARLAAARTLEGAGKLDTAELAAVIAALEQETDAEAKAVERRVLAQHLGVAADRPDLLEHARRRLIEGEEKR